MDKTCATCKNWSPKDSGAMARHRMAICDRKPKWTFFPPQSTCDKHEPAPAAIVQARAVWIAKERAQ